jgi:CRISPR/Cas system-associated exonuclease Cas4 (RecB family)
MLDFNRPAKRTDVPSQEQLDEAAQALSGAPRSYLGGSRLGEECARKLQYEYTCTEPFRISAKLHNIFAAGHASEAAVAQLLRGIFDLRTEKQDGRQFGFETAQGRIKGHIDGVICGGPEALGPYPYLWEAKAVGGKYFAAIVKNGVRAERPVYAGQIATYQAYMQLTENPALFSVANRDTGEVHFERVPFDPKLAQECTDRGVQVLQAVEAGETLPRPYASSDFYKCRFCDFREQCWASP